MAYSKAYARKWRKRNPRKVAEYNRRRRQLRAAYKRRWRKQHPQKARAYLQKWFESNPGKRNEYRAAHQARKKRAAVSLTDAERAQIAAVYTTARLMTMNTGIQYHVDHIIPLARGGLHHPSNLQVITADQNRRKFTKLKDD